MTQYCINNCLPRHMIDRQWKFCPSCGTKLVKSKDMTFDDFLEMFHDVLYIAFDQYLKNRETKKDSWAAGDPEPMIEFLRKKLNEEIDEYLSATQEDTRGEIGDIVNIVLMLGMRERDKLYTSWRQSAQSRYSY